MDYLGKCFDLKEKKNQVWHWKPENSMTFENEIRSPGMQHIQSAARWQNINKFCETRKCYRDRKTSIYV